MAKLGKSELYRGDARSFNHWLRFVLDFANAPLLGEGVETIPEEYNLGLLSFRYLMLSLHRPEKTLLKKPRDVNLTEYVRRKSIVNYVILNESLNEGLLELARNIKPQYFDQAKVEEFFRNQKMVNASTVKADEIAEIDEDVRVLIEDKERILLEFYPSVSVSQDAADRAHRLIRSSNNEYAFGAASSKEEENPPN
ncbi:MAG: hypothetical protein ACRD19_05770 [Terriglobia bacterium]